jgi:hypothetical protein
MPTPGVLFAINPSRRRRRAKSRKHRSPAQKAATRRMLAANRAKFGVNPSRRRRRRVKHHAVAAAPRRHYRRNPARRSRRSYRRNPSILSGAMGHDAINLLKAGAIGGAGALGVDLIMGQVKGFLPASMQTPADSAGSMNYGYFAVKGALALALGIYGRKIMPAAMAGQMAEGSLTVMAYTLMRPMIPSSF